MKTNEKQQEVLENLQDHVLTVEVNAEVNRVIKFQRGESSSFLIYITTWHNHLCYSGDLGTFVFSHSGVPDMLKFFNQELSLGYLQEKLVCGEAKDFDREQAYKDIKADVDDYREAQVNDLDDNERDEEYEKIITDEIMDDVESAISEFKTIDEFLYWSQSFKSNGFEIDWETACDIGMVYTWRYQFACEAIRLIAGKVLGGAS